MSDQELGPTSDEELYYCSICGGTKGGEVLSADCPKCGRTADDLETQMRDIFADGRAFRMEQLRRMYELPPHVLAAMDTALVELSWNMRRRPDGGADE